MFLIQRNNKNSRKFVGRSGFYSFYYVNCWFHSVNWREAIPTADLKKLPSCNLIDNYKNIYQ